MGEQHGAASVSDQFRGALVCLQRGVGRGDDSGSAQQCRHFFFCLGDPTPGWLYWHTTLIGRSQIYRTRAAASIAPVRYAPQSNGGFFSQVSIETGPLDVAAVISRGLEAETKAGRPSSWRLRTAWKDAQTNECFVLVSDSMMAQPETLKHLVEKASKEGKLGSPCSALHLFHQRTEWVS